MKKIISYIFFIILLCFFIPIIFTNKSDIVDTFSLNVLGSLEEHNLTQSEAIAEALLENYNYEKYNTINLLHQGTGEIQSINFDEYLCGVISAEMPASYELEALKSQAIVARTYTLYKIINSKPHGEDVSICDSFQCCQAWISKEERFNKWDDALENEYWNKIVTAVNETKGKVITYEGKIINAFFHANSGGKTEIPINVWGGTNYPYLQVVETSGEEGYTQYSSEVEMTIEEFVNKLKEKYEDLVVDIAKVTEVQDENEEIKVLEYTESGRVKTLKVGNKNIAGTEVRSVLGLKSTNFDMEIDFTNNKIKFNVIGYGHGIGMSQTGADAMAKQGSTCEQIIKHFYVGVEIIDI